MHLWLKKVRNALPLSFAGKGEGFGIEFIDIFYFSVWNKRKISDF